MVYRALRPFLFRLDSEKAHMVGLRSARFLPRARGTDFPELHTRVAGLEFPNPLGLAAGFDKDAYAPNAMLRSGFGFVEVGSITPRPQDGNPLPRLFRLVEDEAVINRMGFNNAGAEIARRRLSARQGRGGIVGINIGANKDSADRIADYAKMTRIMAPLADYLAVNISSPNTPGLRALQDEGALVALLDAVFEARAEDGPPVFLKVAPDLEPADIDAIARIALDKGLAALIVSNTTIGRPKLRSRHHAETGGLSGAPLRPLALQRVRDFRQATGGAMPLIGVGGIATAQHALERIKAGASLVQLYSAMVYGGPGLPRRIVRDLAKLVKREGFANIAEAVGTE